MSCAVAESGIHSGADIARLRAAGYQAFLIGESLMKAESPGSALRTLLTEATVPVSASSFEFQVSGFKLLDLKLETGNLKLFL